MEETEITERNRLGSYKYLGNAIRIHDLERRKNWEEVHLEKCKLMFICSLRQSLVVPLCPMSRFT